MNGRARAKGIYEITYICDTMADGDMMYGSGNYLIGFHDYLRILFLFYDSYEVINEKKVSSRFMAIMIPEKRGARKGS